MEGMKGWCGERFCGRWDCENWDNTRDSDMMVVGIGKKVSK